VTSEHDAFQVLSIFEDEPVLLDDDRLQWVPVRRRLGIAAFGTNAYRAERAGDAVIEDHVESPGQEELYVVLRGRAEFRVGDEVVEAAAGGAVFVPEPGLQRRALALEDATVVLAVGGWRDRPYHDLPWEPIYLARQFMRRGDWAAAAETLEREAGEHRESAIVRYRLACCRARLGQHDVALAELGEAIEASPGMRERAQSEEAFASLRDLPGWPAA
jgi:mannose-6-phosphate isomerase-like protein (cupin superfamily)